MTVVVNEVKKCLSDVVLSFPFLHFCFHVKKKRERERETKKEGKKEIRTKPSASVSFLKGSILISPVW